jgi:hypothetical protein
MVSTMKCLQTLSPEVVADSSVLRASAETVALFAANNRYTEAEAIEAVWVALRSMQPANGVPESRFRRLLAGLDSMMAAAWRDGVERRAHVMAQRLPLTAQRLACLHMALAVWQQQGEITAHETGVLLQLQQVFELTDAQIDQMLECCG